MDALANTMTSSLVWTDNSAVLLLDVVIKGTALLLIVSGIVLALRNYSASVRHMAWFGGIVCLLVLPFAASVMPGWKIPGTEVVAAWIKDEVVDSPLPASAPTAPAPTAATSTPVPPLERQISAPPVPPTVEHLRKQADSRIGMQDDLERPPAPVTREQRAFDEVEERPLAASVAANWTFLVPLAWLVGAVACISWMFIGVLRTWLVARNTRTIKHGAIASLFEELAEELDLSGRVILKQSRGSAMPMAWGLKPKILLPAEADDWTDARLRTVLLHELAHVKRSDYLTQQIARFVASFYWFNPLVWFAVHRMRVERELACDDLVLSTGSKASEYAGHLLDIARKAGGGAYAPFGGVAMARRSRLSDRLLAVLDDNRRREPVSSKLSFCAWVGAACMVFPIAGAGVGSAATTQSLDGEAPIASPAVEANTAAVASVAPPSMVQPTASPISYDPVPALHSAGVSDIGRYTQQGCDWSSRYENTSSWMSGEDGDYRVRITAGDCRLDIEIVGDVEFSDDESDIVYISRDGYFEIEERDGRYRRRLIIEPVGGGDLEYRWYEAGEERPYDRAAREWFGDLVPILFRRLGLQAEERAARILDRSGVEGVLDELTLIPSDYVARKYYQVLLTDGDLNTAQLRDVVRQAGDELESDYELAQLLVEVAENHPTEESVMVVYVEAAGSIDSDYEQRRVLDAILSRQDLSQEVADEMLQLATDIDSDYELAELLIAMLDRHPIAEVLTDQFFDAIHTLESDYEHHRVLKAALHEGAPSQEVLDLALMSAERLGSDYERAELLLEVAELYPVGESIPESYLRAAVSMDSDYELGRVLKYLIGNQRLTGAALAMVLDASLTLDSDYELTNLLIEILDRYELSPSEWDTFFLSLASVESDYERTRLLTGIVEGRVDEGDLHAVLEAAMDIDSDYELANLLVKIAEHYTVDGDTRTLFMNATNRISSDYERGRVLSALHPRGVIQD